MRNDAGQVLIEVIIAALLVIMISLAITQVVSTSLKGSTASLSAGSATFLSGEAVDAVRAVAREDWHTMSNLATSSSNLYHPAISGGKWTIATGTETIALNNLSYVRSFYLTDVYRSTSSGNIVTSGGYYDPSVLKVNVKITWNDVQGNSQIFTQAAYVSRYLNQTYAQQDWVGGAAGEVVTSAATNTFSTSTNIDFSATGSIKLVTQ